MGFEPRSHWEDKVISQRELQDRLYTDGFARQMDRITDELKAQMILAQASQEEFANRNRQLAPRYQV